MVSNLNQPLEMKGFKGFHFDPKKDKFFCEPQIYKKYYFSNKKNNHVDGTIRMCANGLHFCNTLEDVKSYFSHCRNDVFYAEVLASGTIVNKDDYFFTEGYYDKLATSDLKITRVIPNIEALKAFGYVQTGGAKKIKNLQNCKLSGSDVFFNTPKLFKEFLKKVKKHKYEFNFPVTIVYFKDDKGNNWPNTQRVIISID